MAKRKRDPRERFSFLRELVTEFQDTSSADAKEQVLANLANFAYDPDNYVHMKELNVVDLFLDQLQDENKNLVEFAMAGICNLALDKNFKQLIYKRGGIDKIITCLSSEREDTVLSAITALMFLVCQESKADITSAPVIDCMLKFQESNNKRFSNLASLFLQDYCTPDQIQYAKYLSQNYSQTSTTS